MTVQKIKWGILGTSYISEVMARAIHDSERGELCAIASRSSVSGSAFAATFSIPTVHDSHEAMLHDENIDAIYIGLPNHLHAEWVMRCAEAGKHVLCEKPFVISIDEAERVFAKVKEANVFCMEALMYRCHPFINKIKTLLDEKIIGDIKLFNAVYTAHIIDVANPIAGGAIRNLGCYPVSLVRLLADAEPEEMISMGRIHSEYKNDSQASVLLRFPNNVMASISTADDIKMYHQFDVYGTKGKLSVISNPWMPTQHNNTIMIHLFGEDSPQVVEVHAEKPLYAYQIDVMSENILTGRRRAHNSGGVSWQDSLNNIKVLETWREQIGGAA